MKNIGEMTRKDNGTVIGHVAETHYDFEIALGRFESEQADGADFQLMTKSPRGRPVPLGRLWQDKGKESGATYFRGYIRSHESGYVRLQLHRSRDKSNVWDVVRSDTQRRRGAQGATLPDAPPPAPEPQRKAKAPANDTASDERQAA